MVDEEQPALVVGARTQPPGMSLSNSPQASTNASRPVGLQGPGDAVGPDVGHLAHIGEVATQDGPIGFHPDNALKIVATIRTASTSSPRPARARRSHVRTAARVGELVNHLSVDHRGGVEQVQQHWLPIAVEDMLTNIEHLTG